MNRTWTVLLFPVPSCDVVMSAHITFGYGVWCPCTNPSSGAPTRDQRANNLTSACIFYTCLCLLLEGFEGSCWENAPPCIIHEASSPLIPLLFNLSGGTILSHVRVTATTPSVSAVAQNYLLHPSASWGEVRGTVGRLDEREFEAPRATRATVELIWEGRCYFFLQWRLSLWVLLVKARVGVETCGFTHFFCVGNIYNI